MANKNKLTEKKQTAMAMMQANNLPAAKTLLIDVCKKDKQDTEAWHLSGILYGRMGQLKNAADCFYKVVALRPEWPEGHDNLGVALLGSGQPDQAEKSFRNAIRRNPHYKNAYVNLAHALHQQGNLPEAIRCLNTVLKDNLSDPAIHFTLGSIYSESGNQADAAACLEKAIALKPDFFEAHGTLGGIYNKQGKLGEALAAYNHMLQLRPDSPDVLAAIAQIHEKQGDTEKAYRLLDTIADRHPENSNIALALGLTARNLPIEEKTIARIKRTLSYNNSLDDNTRGQLYRLLGGLYDQVEDYKHAFEYYKKANTIKKYPFDINTSQDEFSRLKKVFCRNFSHDLPHSTQVTDSPIFILGMIRSGTSLVEQILCSHPLVYGAGELDALFNIVRSLATESSQIRSYPECLTALSQETIHSAANKYLEYTRQLAGSSRNITDKMPHNFLNLGLIELLFPNARVIHCMREPLDTCLSCYFQDFGGRHPYTSNLADLGAYYRQYQDLMTHWKAVLGIKMLDIKYENLVQDPEKYSRLMVDFCGLEWDDSCLEFYAAKRIVKTASYHQVRQPLYTKSIGRWENYESFLGPLISALD